MKAAIVGKFTAPVPGREKAGIAYAREVDDFYGKKAAEDLCTVPKWFWDPVGENLWIVEGEYDALLGILATPKAQKFLGKSSQSILAAVSAGDHRCDS